MKWRSYKEKPQPDQLVWIITDPHKETPVSRQIAGGYVFFNLEDRNLWGIDNGDETGHGCQTWYTPSWEYSRGRAEEIIGWMPVEEMPYPEELNGKS